MASKADVRFKAEVLLLLNRCLFLPLVCGFCVSSMVCCAVLCVLSSYVTMLTGKRAHVDFLCLTSWCSVTVIVL